MLDTARWYTSASARLYERYFEEAYRQRAAALRTDVVPFADFWLMVNDALFDQMRELTEPAVEELRQRWTAILDLPPGASRVQFSSADLRERVASELAVQPLPWPMAVHHSPDLMVAGADVSAGGRLTWVLGEVHPSVVTPRYASWVAFHDAPETLRAAIRHDLRGNVVWIAWTAEDWRCPARLRQCAAIARATSGSSSRTTRAAMAAR